MKKFSALFCVIVSGMLLSIVGLQSYPPSASADEVDATADPVSGILTIHAIDIPGATGSVNVFEARLQLVDIHSLTFELISALPSNRAPGNNATGDSSTGIIIIPTLALGTELYSITMALLPATNPLAFQLTHFARIPNTPLPFPFDGIWKGNATPTTATDLDGFPCDSATFTMSIVNHEISGTAQTGFSGEFTLEGLISNNDQVSFGIALGNEDAATFDGIFMGDIATGTYEGIFGCRGTWSAARV